MAVMNAGELFGRLRRHYIPPQPLPGGSFFTEVVLENRRIDALYVGFTQSRGRYLIGHEVKVARTDWLRELDDPTKADVWGANCHAWYVVAPDTDIVRVEELPHRWGLMIPSSRSKVRMQIVKAAEVDSTVQPSWAAAHAIIQKADTERAQTIESIRQKARADAREEMEREVQRRVAAATGNDRLIEKIQTQQNRLNELEEILGMKVSDYAWRDSTTTVEQIRESFARWLAADQQVDNAIRGRIYGLAAAEKALREARRTLEAAGLPHT